LTRIAHVFTNAKNARNRRICLHECGGSGYATTTKKLFRRRRRTVQKFRRSFFTVGQALLILAKAMKALEQPGLGKSEILRLRGLVQACKVYQDKFGEYVDYLRIETELELKDRVAKLRKNSADNEKANA
jgi:hypothetical protein